MVNLELPTFDPQTCSVAGAGVGCVHVAVSGPAVPHGRVDLLAAALLLRPDQGSGHTLPPVRHGALPAAAISAEFALKRMRKLGGGASRQ